MYKHAVVATKAYPLHYGHIHVIDTAIRQSEDVTVLLVYGVDQTPSGDERAEALRRTYPNINVRLVADIYTDDSTPESSLYWAQYALDIMNGVDFDVVVGSEPYIERWAHALDVDFIAVDTRRTIVPVSGTEIRKNPMEYWSYIAPEFRTFYLKRVLLVGAESTGKTTLAKNLSRHYGTRFVPEYGRYYVEKMFNEGDEIDDMTKRIAFGNIVNEQPRLEREIEQQCHRVCFYDTDLFTTSLWYEQWQPHAIMDDLHRLILSRQSKYDMVLLQHDDTKWIDDGYREQNQKVRGQFTEDLWNYHRGAHVLHGSWDTRQKTAIQLVDELLGRP